MKNDFSMALAELLDTRMSMLRMQADHYNDMTKKIDIIDEKIEETISMCIKESQVVREKILSIFSEPSKPK